MLYYSGLWLSPGYLYIISDVCNAALKGNLEMIKRFSFHIYYFVDCIVRNVIKFTAIQESIRTLNPRESTNCANIFTKVTVFEKMTHVIPITTLNT